MKKFEQSLGIRIALTMLFGLLGSTHALAQDAERLSRLQEAAAEVARAKDLMIKGDYEAAEPRLNGALRTYDLLHARSVEGSMLLGFLMLHKQRNQEAFDLLGPLFKPGKNLIHSPLLTVAACRLGNVHQAKWPLVSQLDNLDRMPFFGGKENVPPVDTLEGLEAFAWLFLARNEKWEWEFRMIAAESAAALFPQSPAVEYWLGVLKLERGHQEEAKSHLLAAEHTGKGKLPDMAREKLSGMP